MWNPDSFLRGEVDWGAEMVGIKSLFGRKELRRKAGFGEKILFVLFLIEKLESFRGWQVMDVALH